MDDYPLLDVFLTMMWFFLWVMWIFLLIKIWIDIFRDHSLSGWSKALWIVLVLVLPFIGVLVYLIVRGRSMGEREVQQAKDQQEAFRQYVQETAGSGGATSHADELSKLAALKERGDISQEEFEKAKAKILA
ncbi:SHOCT domain-containing protein [Streptomyces sp. NBC_00094]|uniref:SHOCT domain-containing protein n=1 Tax=Streptomyces sp. NBC_00094 TaxID=2903620 RepID=UPI002253F6A4|nr:SHOCT domain-containing protein [Streptomyces sp. NBC_00094]MCX5390553.1 SHOCT domain-containing protein [Streptomyces sp. NBC_00094]